MSNTILNELLLIFKKHLTKSTMIKDSVAFYIHTCFPIYKLKKIKKKNWKGWGWGGLRSCQQSLVTL